MHWLVHASFNAEPKIIQRFLVYTLLTNCLEVIVSFIVLFLTSNCACDREFRGHDVCIFIISNLLTIREQNTKEISAET